MDNLTALSVKQAKPKEKPYRMFDGLGLYLHVQPNGSKYWRMKYRYADKEKTFSIGTYPIFSLREAREARNQAKKLLAQGIDPSAKKQADKRARKESGANTFEALASEWFITKMHDKSKSHQKHTQSLINIHLLPAFGKMPIKDITPASSNRAIVKCGVWRSCSRPLMSLHFFHSIDEANIPYYISKAFKTS